MRAESCAAAVVAVALVSSFHPLVLWLQPLLAHVDRQELLLHALRDKASELEQVTSRSSVDVTGHMLLSLWQRWSRLRSVGQAQERALEDTAREWRNFTEKV